MGQDQSIHRCFLSIDWAPPAVKATAQGFRDCMLQGAMTSRVTSRPLPWCLREALLLVVGGERETAASSNTGRPVEGEWEALWLQETQPGPMVTVRGLC